MTAAEAWDLLVTRGGPTFVLLAIGSLVAVTICLERLFVLWNLRRGAERLCDAVVAALDSGDPAAARVACASSRSPLAEVFRVGLEGPAAQGPDVVAAVSRARQRLVLDLRGPLWLLATIGATAPFVGLFGTVVGIMEAFRAIGETHQAGIDVVGPGIAEALVATAVGILVAVVALVAYNYFQARLGRAAIELRLLVEEFLERLPAARRESEAA